MENQQKGNSPGIGTPTPDGFLQDLLRPHWQRPVETHSSDDDGLGDDPYGPSASGLPAVVGDIVQDANDFASAA